MFKKKTGTKVVFLTAWMTASILTAGCSAGKIGDSSVTYVSEESEIIQSEDNSGQESDMGNESGAESESETEQESDAEAASGRSESDIHTEIEERMADPEAYLLDDSGEQDISWESVRDLTPEECRLARNEIYARHGRKFQSEDLKEYFLGKSWYRAELEPEVFDEGLLSYAEKRNVYLLKGMELSAGVDDLPEAPSKAVIDRYGYESGYSVLSFDLKEDTLKDCGEYFEIGAVYGQGIEVPGDLEEGDTVTVVFNELTGDTRTLVRKGDFLFEKGQEEYSSGYYYRQTEDHSPVVLYCDSDDRIDKPVYDGKLYIRKDASVEVAIEAISEPITSDRLMRSYNWFNGVYFDRKGYAVRLVFYGD